jgi:SAM-dependent methyltransferase
LSIDPSKHNNAAFDLDYYVRRFDAAAFYILPLLQALPRDFSNATALDIGCGLGLIALGLCSGFKNYVGIEIDQTSIDTAKALHAAAGTSNCSFHLMSAKTLPVSLSSIGLQSPPDVVIMTASLEHLTPQERTPVYAFLRDVMAQGSLVLILDTPNRLNPFDGHSTDLHFVQMLPDYLAAMYTKRSPRKYSRDFFERINWPNEDERWHGPQPMESLYRLGRAISYHDLEVYLEGSSNLQIAMDGWDPLRLNFQPPTRSEFELESYFAHNCPSVHCAYSRFWVDLGLSTGLGQTNYRAHLIKPEVEGAVTVYNRPYWYSLDDYFAAGSTSSLVFSLNERNVRSASLVIDGSIEDQQFELLADGSSFAKVDLRAIAKQRPPTWHAIFVLPIEVPKETQKLALRPVSSSQCCCQGIIVH